jgi:hypothetical protein
MAMLSLFGVITLGVSNYLAPSPVRFGMVDLAGVIGAREKEFTDMLLKKDTSDADRAKAFDLVKKTSEDLTQALTSLRKDCQCNLLVAGALVTGDKEQIPDYTTALKTALNIK